MVDREFMENLALTVMAGWFSLFAATCCRDPRQWGYHVFAVLTVISAIACLCAAFQMYWSVAHPGKGDKAAQA